MRRLAPFARHSWSRSQDSQTNGLERIKNGELLARAVAGSFEVFITSDRNLSYQQNLSAFPIAVVVLKARSNRLVELKKLVPILLATVNSAKPGTVTVVTEG